MTGPREWARGRLRDVPGRSGGYSRRTNSDNMGAAGGLFFTAAQVGGVMGPVLFGVLADATGDYHYPLWSLAAVSPAVAAWVRRLR